MGRYMAWHGYQGITDLWRRVFGGEHWEAPPVETEETHNVGSDFGQGDSTYGRRKLESLTPIKQEHRECVQDPERTEEECMNIVEDIFAFLKRHDDEFKPLPSTVEHVERTIFAGSVEDDNGADTDGANTGADTSGDNSNNGANSGIRR